MSEVIRDAEKWALCTAITVHEREHDCFLAECKNPICIALAALATEIEIRNEMDGGVQGL